MSELIQKNKVCNFRWKLLAEASAVALMGYFVTMPGAIAEDNDRPTVWIELGGQFNNLQNNQERYSPPFLALMPAEFPLPGSAEQPPRYGFEESGAIQFQPSGADWKFTAAIRYGRAISSKHMHHQSYPGTTVAYQ